MAYQPRLPGIPTRGLLQTTNSLSSEITPERACPGNVVFTCFPYNAYITTIVSFSMRKKVISRDMERKKAF